MSFHINEKRLLVKAILEHALDYKWSLQGFGMLRLYLSNEVRMHVWSKGHQTPEVTLLHNHPWHFQSSIICGQINNVVFTQEKEGATNYVQESIVCGPGGCAKGDQQEVRLVRDEDSCKRYVAGESYRQVAAEIHYTNFAPGTVTLVTRRFLKDTEHALVFYPIGKTWVSAEPRDATVEEIIAIAGLALQRIKAEDDMSEL